MLLVSEREIARAVGAYAAAGSASRAPPRPPRRAPQLADVDGAVVLIVTGRNIDDELHTRAGHAAGVLPRRDAVEAVASSDEARELELGQRDRDLRAAEAGRPRELVEDRGAVGERPRARRPPRARPRRRHGGAAARGRALRGRRRPRAAASLPGG